MIKVLLAFPTPHVRVLCASFMLMDTLEAAADALSTWVPAAYVGDLEWTPCSWWIPLWPSPSCCRHFRE